MDRINFKINGNKYSVGSELSADTSLNEFIRRHAHLRGTKYMCLEGGCGACVVNVRALNVTTQEYISFSINSCLVTILSCDGWEITTIEGIGDRKNGYNIISKRLNHFFGSQCGYCSPGMVMSMYSLIQNNDHHLTEEQIEKSFGSNLCRCTGYRPILEAFKSLAKNPSEDVLKKIKDIEDIDGQVCSKSGRNCKETCRDSQDLCVVGTDKPVRPKKITLSDGRLWYAVNDVKSIFRTLEDGYNSYMLVAGNTAKGVKPIVSYPHLMIDISSISELTSHYLDVNLVLGGNITITDTMNIFQELSKSNENFWYLRILYDHLLRVAHIPVRNIGTVAGNLALKNQYPEFQSDIFLLLDCVGAVVTLVSSDMTQTDLSMPDFLTTNLKGRVITQIKLPPLSRHYKMVTYKITPREQNAHAEVNSAFLFKFDPHTNHIEKASIVYGGINPSFTHAYKTEHFLLGKYIFNNEVLQSTLRCLHNEINPNVNPPDPTPHFRRKLALSLFYKCVIKLCPHDILNPKYESGATSSYEDKPSVSKSYQEYETDEDQYPITQPILKKEGLIQCTGEAEYTDDLPTIPNEVFAAFVLSTMVNGHIESIDASEAMKVDGIIAVLTSADIPGYNSIVRPDYRLMFEHEELLASDKVVFYNQPVAIVVAKTQILADQISYLVKVNYKSVSKKPIVFTIEDAIKAPKEDNRLVPYPGITPTDRGANIQKVIKGKFESPRQYHFTMELHTTVTKPVDDLLEVYSSTQWLDMTQAAIAQLLGIKEHSIIVKTRRCGGGFGSKISRFSFAACATALVAKLLNVPCRMSMHLRDIMRAIGKRPNSRLDYEVGVDQRGEIQYLDGVFYVNDGHSRNENENLYVTSSFQNCYDSRRWKVDSFGAMTDAPTNCAMRAPGGFEGISSIEHIMDHIADELKLDPVEVRFANYRREDNDLPALMPIFLDRVKYKEREKEIKEFNAHNRWKKRGINLANMGFPTAYLGNYGALVSVSHGDGSVFINIGGIEIGQGINTRVAQAAANEFHLPVEKVAVLPAFNFATPNNMSTASSITTECCMYAVIRCCDEINARLAPVRSAMPTASWKEIVFEADLRGIDLQATYLTSEYDPRTVNYTIFGIAAVEVEIDVLTGTKWIVRADVMEDVGRSINPALDVGQVEGAFVQSLSLWLMEDTKYNEKTGEIYTDRTWNYKIIGARDIPQDFRVYLRKKAVNPVGILGSKAVAEPPTCLAHAIVHALRRATESSRQDSGYDTTGFLALCGFIVKRFNKSNLVFSIDKGNIFDKLRNINLFHIQCINNFTPTTYLKYAAQKEIPQTVKPFKDTLDKNKGVPVTNENLKRAAEVKLEEYLLT